MKILPVGAEFFHAEGRTDLQADTIKLIVAFRNFANALKNSTFCPHSVYVCFEFKSEQTAIISYTPLTACYL